MKKVLFWDFHGTLTYPDQLWSRSVHQAIQSLWPDRSISLQQVSAGQKSGAFPWDCPEKDYRHLTEPARWWTHVGGMFYNTGISCGLSDAEACQAAPLVRDFILNTASFRLYEDAVSTLQTLSADGWRHVMLSNNFPELMDLSYQIGIGEYFDDFIVSALVGFDKPRREIFDIARTRAGYPDICLMIGDNFAADIIGAQMAGMQCVQVHQQDPAAPFYCAQLADLVPLLRQHFTNAVKEDTSVEKIEPTS